MPATIEEASLAFARIALGLLAMKMLAEQVRDEQSIRMKPGSTANDVRAT